MPIESREGWPMTKLLCAMCLLCLVVGEGFLITFWGLDLQPLLFGTVPYALLGVCLHGLRRSPRALIALFCTSIPVVALGVCACRPEASEDKDEVQSLCTSGAPRDEVLAIGATIAAVIPFLQLVLIA